VKRTIVLAVIFLVCSSIQRQNLIRTVFGVKVSYQSNGSMITLVAYLHNGRTLSHQKILSLRDFSFFASGEWPSVYNPDRADFFEENNVPGGVYTDSITQEKIPYCFALDSLWKIRFRMYPFQGKNEKGWSQEASVPSLSQKKYLYERYGVDQIDFKYILDTSFWKLLRDVRDPNWIATYRNI